MIPRSRIEEVAASAAAALGDLSPPEPGTINRPLIRRLGEVGFLDPIFDLDGIPAAELCAIRHGLSLVDTEAETAFALQGLGGHPIARSGSADLVARWVPEIRSGRAVAAFALTEPDAGSDAGAIQLAAEPEGEGFRLTGVKTYISNAPDADVYTVFARTSPGERAGGVTAFAVDGGADGLTGETIPMINHHPIGRLDFDGVYVERGALLGEIGGGFRVAMATLDLFRPSVGAFAVGMAEAALSIATRHAASRRAFGKPISEFQGVSHQLADVRTAIEASALLVYSAAAALEGGEESATGRAAMAKLHATEAAQKAVDVAIQVLGARALEADSRLARLYLEVRAPRIYEGTSEIQRNIIAREMFGGRI